MRILITGGGDIGRITAERLIGAGHEVMLVDEEREACERLATELDAIVICGDATRPDILEKAGIEEAELVIALSGSDKMNLITALVAKEYGVKRVIVKLDDTAFNTVCRKLGVEEIVNPKTATAKHIADMTKRPHALEVSTLVGGEIRVFSAQIRKDEHAGSRLEDIKLKEGMLPVVIEREGEYFLASGGFKLMKGDKLTVLYEEGELERLQEIFE